VPAKIGILSAKKTSVLIDIYPVHVEKAIPLLALVSHLQYEKSINVNGVRKIDPSLH
jgi:hypothetical protein